MADYIYQLKPTRSDMLSGNGPTEAESGIIAEHFAYLSDLHKAGVVSLAGRTDTDHAGTFGIVLLEADSTEAAEHVMQQDPAVAAGVMAAELYPFRIAIGALAQASQQYPGKE